MLFVSDFRPFALAVAFLASLSACTAPQGYVVGPDGINDPYERTNRKVHAFNRGLDRAIVRPAGKGYSALLPDEVEDSVGNFATNLDQPSQVVNATIQGDLRGAGISTSRFLINTVLGIGGLFDVASDFGVAEHETDFGETLHVWGVKEGAYLELPVIGPTTQRDVVGLMVDLFSNPLRYTLDPPEENYGSVAGVASRLGDRGRFADAIDSILYESADSYAQARLVYLQRRRAALGDESTNVEIDPFALDTEGF